MRSFLRYFFVMAAAIYLHRGVLPLLLTADLTPDLTIISVVYLSITIGGLPAIFLGFGVGLLSDLFGWGPVGVGALAGTLTAAAGTAVRQRIYDNSLFVPAVIATLGTLLKATASFVVLAAFAGPLNFGWHVLKGLGLQGGVTAAAATVVIFIYWRILPPSRAGRRARLS